MAIAIEAITTLLTLAGLAYLLLALMGPETSRTTGSGGKWTRGLRLM
jgi:hypothetical protein